MTGNNWLLLATTLILAVSTLAVWSAGDATLEPLVFHGASDASAALALDDRHIIVGDDECNTLLVYDIQSPSAPVARFDLRTFLQSSDKQPEADIEGAAWLGNLAFWMTSHGRNSEGQLRLNRHNLFAARVTVTTQPDGKSVIAIEPVGRSCQTLLQQMLMDPAIQKLNLARIAKLDDKKDKDLAPKKEGINMEGLCASADGRQLYLGFRNPLHTDPRDKKKKAILITLCNPLEVVMEQKAAVWDAPALLDLNGLGIRSMEYLPARKLYLIVAGSPGTENQFAFYGWDGNGAHEPQAVTPFSLPENFTPEALFGFAAGGKLGLLSDDGTLEIAIDQPEQCLEGEILLNGKCPNKFLKDSTRKTFRALFADDAKVAIR